VLSKPNAELRAPPPQFTSPSENSRLQVPAGVHEQMIEDMSAGQFGALDLLLLR